MCSKKTIERIESGQALVVSKTRLFIWIVLLVIGASLSYGDLRSEVKQNSKCNIEQGNDLRYMKEIRYNIRSICAQLNVDYIEEK